MVFPFTGTVNGDQQCVNITIEDDMIVEGEHSFALHLGDGSPVDQIMFSTVYTTITIADNDGKTMKFNIFCSIRGFVFAYGRWPPQCNWTCYQGIKCPYLIKNTFRCDFTCGYLPSSLVILCMLVLAYQNSISLDF